MLPFSAGRGCAVVPAFLVARRAVLGLSLLGALGISGCERSALTELGHTTGGGTGGTTGDMTGGATGDTTGDTTGDSGKMDGGDSEGGSSGGSTNSTGGDAGGTTGSDAEVDAGCADKDDDGVCDADDNCPNTANTDQADADGNGVGDACESCDISVTSGTVAAPPGTLSDPQDGQVFVGNVVVDGSGGNVTTVSAGSSFKVDFDYAVKLCTDSNTQHIVIGVEGASPDCPVERSCAGAPIACNIPIVKVYCDPSISATATLTAPTAPGKYYILMARGLDSCNGDWPGGSEPGSDQRIGAICVH